MPVRFPFILIFLILTGAVGCARTMPLLAPTAPPLVGPTVAAPISAAPMPVQDIVHEVGPMETLWRIGKMYQVPPEVIMQANAISDPSKIRIGQKLLIPQAHPLRPVISLYPTNRWTYIVIHHTATETGSARTIHSAHQRRQFWNGMGYHFLIDNGTFGKQDGQIEEGPRWVKQQEGAHCNAAGMNQRGIGIALVGNFDEGSVTQRQFESLVYLVDILRRYYHIPTSRILRHDDVPSKATQCPGKNFPWAQLLRRLNQTA